MEKITKKLTIEDSRERAFRFLRAALSKKAFRPILLRLDKITPIADYFLIVSGRSARHATAIAEAIIEAAHVDSTKPYSTEGMKQGNWVLLDFGEIIIHVFQDQSRDFYDLEGLWSDAPRELFPPDLTEEIETAREMGQTDDDDFMTS
ncbi:MAG: ribosome silencing factor [Desulfomonilaceae bacterium]